MQMFNGLDKNLPNFAFWKKSSQFVLIPELTPQVSELRIRDFFKTQICEGKNGISLLFSFVSVRFRVRFKFLLGSINHLYFFFCRLPIHILCQNANENRVKRAAPGVLGVCVFFLLSPNYTAAVTLRVSVLQIRTLGLRVLPKLPQNGEKLHI